MSDEVVTSWKEGTDVDEAVELARLLEMVEAGEAVMRRLREKARDIESDVIGYRQQYRDSRLSSH